MVPAEQSTNGTKKAALTDRKAVPARLAAYPAQFSEWITVRPPAGSTGRDGPRARGDHRAAGRHRHGAVRPCASECADREHEGRGRHSGAGAMKLPHLSSFPVRGRPDITRGHTG